jgi:hypothetical protein
MAKMRKSLIAVLRNAGDLVFNALSRCQDTPFLSKTARFLKVSLLGLVVALIASCGKKARPGPGGDGGPITTCYMVRRMDPEISVVQASPNPTRGAHSIKITGTARVLEPGLDNNYVSDAWLVMATDTARKIRMYPVDGRFSDTVEMIEARISVAGLKPGTTFVYVHAATSKGEESLVSLPLFITEEESK